MRLNEHCYYSMLSIVSKLKNFEIEQLLVWPVLAAKLSRRHDGSPGSIPVAGPICPCAPFSGLWQRNPGVLTFSPVEEHTSILLLAALRPGWDLRHPDEAGAPDCGTAYTVGRTSGPDGTGAAHSAGSRSWRLCVPLYVVVWVGAGKVQCLGVQARRGAHTPFCRHRQRQSCRPLGPAGFEAARPAAAYLVTSMLLFIIWVRLRVASGFDDASAD